MDDSGVADAFYTVLSIAIVMTAAIAVSGVVLSTTMKQSSEAGTQIAGFSPGGMEKGLYGLYYTVDKSRSDFSSGDPNGVILKKLVLEKVDDVIALNSSSLPPAAPTTQGAILWSGYCYAKAAGNYVFELKSESQSWLWIDGNLAASNVGPGFSSPKDITLHLETGYHTVKMKFYYPDTGHAFCTLSWQQGSQMVPVGPLYR